jgi:hypothetical protein
MLMHHDGSATHEHVIICGVAHNKACSVTALLCCLSKQEVPVTLLLLDQRDAM